MKKKMKSIFIVVGAIALAAFFVWFGFLRQSVSGSYVLNAESVPVGQASAVEFFYGLSDADWTNKVYLYLDESTLLGVQTGTFTYDLDTSSLEPGVHKVTAVVQRMCINNCGGSEAIVGNRIWIPEADWDAYAGWVCNLGLHPENAHDQGAGINYQSCTQGADVNGDGSLDAGQIGAIGIIEDSFEVYAATTSTTTSTTSIATTTTTPIDPPIPGGWLVAGGIMVALAAAGFIFRKRLFGG